MIVTAAKIPIIPGFPKAKFIWAKYLSAPLPYHCILCSGDRFWILKEIKKLTRVSIKHRERDGSENY
jgi:hypothetical protein